MIRAVPSPPAPVVVVGRLRVGFAAVVVEARRGSPEAVRPVLRLRDGQWTPCRPDELKPGEPFKVHDLPHDTFLAKSFDPRRVVWELEAELIPEGL